MILHQIVIRKSTNMWVASAVARRARRNKGGGGVLGMGPGEQGESEVQKQERQEAFHSRKEGWPTCSTSIRGQSAPRSPPLPCSEATAQARTKVGGV